MKKWLFISIIIHQLINSVISSIENLIFNSSLKLILYEDFCVYATEDKTYIYKRNIEGDKDESLIRTPQNIKNKTLIKLSNDSFIVFALNSSDNQLIYSNFIISENKGTNFKKSYINITKNINNHTIKHVDKNKFIVYYNIFPKTIHLYSFDLDSSNIKGGNKEIYLDNNYKFNIIECDSYDGENIFCVYSIIILLSM